MKTETLQYILMLLTLLNVTYIILDVHYKVIITCKNNKVKHQTLFFNENIVM